MDNFTTKKISDFPLTSDPQGVDLIPTIHTEPDGKKVNRNISYDTLRHDARGEKGDQGVVQSVNGKSEQDITLTPEDIGADPAGSATQAELNAKQYTDTVVAQAIADVLSRTI